MMAMATFAMAGCSQNEVTDVNPDTHPAVGFDVYTGVPTRGAETTTATLKDNTKGNFGILAFCFGGPSLGGIETGYGLHLHLQPGTESGTGNCG